MTESSSGTDVVVWISGASSGIGAALAATVPYAEARIVDISRSGGTPGTEHFAADLSDPSSWGAVEAHFAAEFRGFTGQLAVFVHNAGTLTPIGFAGEVDSEAYRRNVLLNSAAPQALGHAFVKTTASWGGEACLVMVTSGAAHAVYEGWSGYCAGKAAVDQWVRVTGAEQEQRGGRCRLLAVAPGTVDTPMQEEMRATSDRDFPAANKFRDMYERGELRDPARAARGIWHAIDLELANGAVIDLRDLPVPGDDPR